MGSEAIANTTKRSGTHRLRVDLEYLNGLRILVRVDGTGIPPEVLNSWKEGHFGLEEMRERADRIGASLDVYSRSGTGTDVIADCVTTLSEARVKGL